MLLPIFMFRKPHFFNPHYELSYKPWFCIIAPFHFYFFEAWIAYCLVDCYAFIFQKKRVILQEMSGHWHQMWRAIMNVSAAIPWMKFYCWAKVLLFPESSHKSTVKVKNSFRTVPNTINSQLQHTCLRQNHWFFLVKP